MTLNLRVSCGYPSITHGLTRTQTPPTRTGTVATPTPGKAAGCTRVTTRVTDVDPEPTSMQIEHHCPEKCSPLSQRRTNIGICFKDRSCWVTIVFRGATCTIFNPKNKRIGEIEVQNGLTRSHISKTNTLGAAGEVIISLEEMHRRMGHVSPRSIKRMIAGKAFTGPTIDDSADLKACESCEYGKATRKPISNVRQSPRATKFGEEFMCFKALHRPPRLNECGGEGFLFDFK